jgi:hypothetical protein
VFSAIEATAHHKCLVITASDESDIAGEDLPSNVAVVHKGLNFSRDLIQFLSAQKLLET